MVVDPVIVNSDADTSYQIECPKINKNNNFDYVTISGEDLKKEYDIDLYKPEYRWVGKKGEYGYGEKLLNQYVSGNEYGFDNTLKENGFIQVISEDGYNRPELQIPRSFFEEGKTYYFRQRVYLKGFGKDIYERGEKVYAVKIAKKLDPKKLELNIDTNGVKLSKVCYGDYLDNVKFSATYGDENENPEDYNLEKFSFNYEIAGQKNSSTDKVNQSGSFNFENNIIFKVVMKNGCGDSIIKYDSITVQALPVLSPNNIVKVNSDVEVEYFDDHVQVTGISGRECKLTIDDKEFSVHDYFYYQQGGKETKISPNMRTYFQSGKQEFFVYKKDKNGNGCKSNEIKVIVIGRENIRGNRFIAGLDTIYVCPGSNVPTLNDSHITIPEAGDNIEFSYKWIYSTNGYTYLPVRNVVGDETILITEPNLSDWKQIINSGESVHIKRVVSVGYNLEDPDNPTILGSDTSNAVVVTTFSDPKIDLELVGDKSLDKYCFGDTITLKTSVDPNFVKECDLMSKRFNFSKCAVNFYDYTANEDGEYFYKKISVLPKDRLVADRYYNLHAGVSYCGDTTFNGESRVVLTHDKLDLTPIVGNCVIVGDSVDVKATRLSSHLAVIMGVDTLVEGDDEVTTQFYVGEDKNLGYKIFIKDNNSGCKNTIDKTISASVIEQKKNPVGIGVNGIEMDSVCAGSELSIISKNVESDKDFYKFSWKVDGIVQSVTTPALNHSFMATGKNHLVERTAYYYKGEELCYTVYDSIKINTYAAVAQPKIEVSADAVCHDGEVTVKTTAMGGGQNRGYKVVFSPGEINAEASIMEGESMSHTFSGLKVNTEFKVEVADAVCSSSMYSSFSEKKLVKVDKDLSFSVSTTSEIITLEDFKDNAIKIPFNFDGITTGDSMSYRVNGGKEVMFMYDGTALSLTLVDSTDFASGNVHLDFVHYGSVAGCSSEIVGYDISINEGFDGIPNITSAGIEDTIEVCAGTEVEMELSGLDDITFDEKPIEEMTGGVWTWYRNNSPVAGGSADGCVVKAEAGKSKTYYARFSAKDAGGKTRRLWSNPFTVIGKAPIKLEKIKFDNYQSQDFVEFCKGSDAKVTIASSQTFGKEVTLQWQYSENTADWTDVPSSWNGGVQTVGVKSISVPASVLGDKTTWFRLSVTDTCGQLAESNLLKVQFKGDVLSPSPVLTSTRIYDSESDIPVALEFARSMNHSPYSFFGATDDEGELEASEVGGRQMVGHKDGSIYKWSFGENIVRAVGTALARVSNEVCYSDTVEYKFRLFQKLGTPQLTKNPAKDTFFCPGDADMKYLHLDKIVGGDSLSYKTYWQYSMDDVNWYAVREGDNDGLFSAGIKAIMYNAGEEYMQVVNVSHLKQTISFRAIVDCEGGYPGTSVMSNMTQTFHVYSPMKDEGILSGDLTVCYGSYPDSIMGLSVSGGSGSYTYSWQMSHDKENWEDIPECSESDFSAMELDKFKLTETTYYRRVVTDAFCGTKNTSMAKHVKVKPEYLMSEDYFWHSSLVQSGNSAEMRGYNMYPDPQLVQEYHWYSSENMKFASSKKDSIVMGEKLQVPNGEESMKVTYYVQGIINGCPTTNMIGFDVLVFNQSGGDIMFEGESETTSKKIICSGEDDITLQSVSAAPNVRYQWMYSINGGINNRLYTKKAVGGAQVEINTESVRLDTTNLSLVNETGVSRTIRFFRNTIIDIGGKTQYLESDTLTLQIVPTLQSVGNTLELDGAFSLAGKIEVAMNKSDYCLGEQPNAVLGGVDVSSSIFGYWQEYRTLFGPWLYDNAIRGGFKTYYEYSTDYTSDSVTWTRAEEYDFDEGKYAGSEEFIVADGALDKSYKVHRVLTDGCTAVESNNVFFNLYDKVPVPDSVKSYAYTPEMTNKTINYAIKTGYEIGDSVVFENHDRNAHVLTWFRDPECTDTLSVGKTWSSMVLDSALLTDNGAFVYVKATRGDCFGEAVAVPFEYGTLSNGGRIVINDTIICQNGMYEDILSEEEADGWYVVPQYQKMQWSYSWQYKWSDSKTARWSDIAGVNTIGLSSEVINSYVKSGSPLYIRRVAVNEKGRVRYSNALRLTHYTALVPGSLIAGDKLTFCTYDELPYVKTTSASGGKVSSIYGENWQYSINGGQWSDMTVLDSLYLGRLTTDLDKTVNNEISIRCLYSDDCDVVSSEEVTFTFYRYNTPPTIYQDNDSCNASVVKLSVYGETDEKSYRWSALYTDPSDSASVEEEIWFNEGEHCTVVRSHLPTNQFGVRSTDIQTGCVSEYFRFNVDSLPALDQEPPSAPHAVCPDEDLTVRGGKVSGGNHDKSYRWQMSSTGEESDFADIAGATGEDMLLEAKYIKGAIYVRRIIEDMCYVDTSVAVMVALREAVVVTAESLKLNDRKCENSAYTVYVDAVKDSFYASEWWSIGADTIREVGVLHQMVGFEGDSVLLPFRRHLTDSLGLTCVSDEVTVVARNKPGLDASLRGIETDDLLPCNESYVEIRGGRQNSEHVTYKWYVNGVEQIGKNSADLSLRAADTMRIVRVMTNGCASVPSDTLVMVGQRVYPYGYVSALDLEVFTYMSDSSVVLEITNSKAFSDGYKFVGDGEMPSVTSNSILLPYDCVEYKDSILDIQAVLPYCVGPYTITPFRGGEIGFEGSTSLCGGGDVPAIVVTELEGGDPSYETTYQWQYRNVYTPDFVNIDGAKGKTYVPAAVDVETTYRRIASRGVYHSVSNELTLSIRPLPEAKTPVIGFSDEEMDEMGLKHGDGFYEWFESVETYLVASATEADEILWEKSLDGETWVSLSKGDSLKVSDPTPTVYYRVVASSACGADTSLSVVMSSRQIAPLTDEDIDWKTRTFMCEDDPDSREYRYFGINDLEEGYVYSFRVESDCNVYFMHPHEGTDRCFDSGRLLGYDCFTDAGELVEDYPMIFIMEIYEDADGLTKYRTPACDVTVHVTRHDTATGLSVSRPYLLETNSLRANFTLQVEDGEVIDVREHEGDVAISQGDRVQFHATPTGNKDMSALTYDWVLQEPVNRRNGEEGRRGLDGLTSKLESPSCYYYNGGYYPMKLVVSDGVCTSELLDTTLYIPQSSVRAQYSLPMELAQEDGFVQMAERIEVSPRLFSSYLDILSSDPDNRHEAVLTDEVGRIIWRGDFAGSVRILTDELASAVYMVVVDGVYTWKVVKR